MARPAKATPAKPSTALIPWDEQLAAEAETAAAMEANTGGGKFYQTRAGVLQWNGSPLPQNRMAVVVLDAIFENTFYEGKFNAEQITPPTCYALSRDEKTIAPYENVFEAGQQQNDTCAGCARAEWGSADTGKGKACRQVRRLAVVPAGTIDQQGRFSAFEDEENFEGGVIGFLKPPVTSVAGYATYVKSVAATLRRPLHGMFTQVSVVPDPKTQFKMVFEALGPIPNELMGAIMKKREEAVKSIIFPYPLEAPAPAAPPVRGKPAGKRKL